MADSEKLDRIYDMVKEMQGKIPNFMTRLECLERHNVTVRRVDRVYITAAAVSGCFSFIGVALGFILKAKGIL